MMRQHLRLTLCLLSAAALSAQAHADTLRVDVSAPGTLPELIGAKKYKITDLTVTGKINGTDMLCLREMAGSDYTGNSTEGELARLDLSAASIVSGGESYVYDDYTGDACYAQDDTVGQAWFSYCGSLQAITLPEGTTSVGDTAFCGCGALTSVTFGSKVADIGEQAFCDCAIESLDIPDSVETIRSIAFSGCNSLRTVHIGKGLKGLEYSFLDTPALENIHVSEENPYFQDIDGVMTYNEGKILMVYPSAHSATYRIPESVEQIFAYAFSGVTGLEELFFGPNVQYVGLRACQEASFTRLELNEGLRVIDDYAFTGSKVETLTLPTALEHLGSSAFYGCEHLSSLTLPPDIADIGGGAFGSLSKLESLDIPDTFTTLSDGMFAGATTLTHLTIGAGITVIPEGCFSNLYALERLSLPAALAEIGTSAFSNDMALKSLTFTGESLTSIGERAFSYCTALEEMTLPASTQTIGQAAFSNCSALREVAIPERVETINDYTFSYCENISKIAIGAGLKEIKQGAFSGCSSLTEIEWNEALTEIGDYAFNYCNSLTLTQLPAHVGYIGQYAFNGADITSITLPASLKSIGRGAFGSYNTTQIEVTSLAEVPPVCEEAAFGMYLDYSASQLSVPQQSLQAYSTAQVWQEFGSLSGIQASVRALDNTHSTSEVWSLCGEKLIGGATHEQIENLPAGIYIIDNKKTIKF